MTTHWLFRVPLLLLGIAVAGAVAVPSGVAALDLAGGFETEGGPRQTATDGDLTWEFAQRGIFADQRVVMGFALFLNDAALISAAGLGGSPLFYGDEEIRSMLATIPMGDAEPLLLVSGIIVSGNSAQLEQARRCRIWTPTSGESLAQREAVLSALAAEVVALFGDLGVVIDPCEVAASAKDADFAVSIVGLASGLAPFGSTSDEMFLRLVAQQVTEPPESGGGAGTGGPTPGGTGPAPAAGGNAGLTSDVSGASRIAMVGMLALVSFVVLGGRWATGTKGGSTSVGSAHADLSHTGPRPAQLSRGRWGPSHADPDPRMGVAPRSPAAGGRAVGEALPRVAPRSAWTRTFRAPADGYSMRQFADDVAALARSRRIRNAVVVGHSMGSTVALEMARRHPRIVTGVVMVDGALEQYATARDVEQTSAWQSLTDRPYAEAITEFYSGFFPDPRDAALASRVVADAAKTPEHAALASFRATLTANIPAIAKQVTQPLLYVGSGGARRLTAARDTLPRAALAQAALSGHFVQLEVPAQLVAMIRRFGDRLGTR